MHQLLRNGATSTTNKKMENEFELRALEEQKLNEGSSHEA
jgi:hypothetical protein